VARVVAGAVILAALAASVVGAVVAVRHRDEGTADRRRLLVISLAVHGVAAAAAWTGLAVAGGGYLFDELAYLSKATSVMATGVPLATHPYLNAVGLLFDVTGPSLAVGRALSLWAGSLIAIAVYELVRQLVGPRPAWWAGLAAAVWPSLIAWSLALGKDCLVVLVLVGVMLGAAKAFRGNWWGVPLAAGTMAALEALRPWAYSIAALAITAGVLVMVWQVRRRAVPIAVSLIVAVGCAGVIGSDGFLGIGFVGSRLGLHWIGKLQSGTSRGETGFDRPLPTSGIDVIEALPSGVVHSVLGPLPWDPGPAVARALILVELPLWYAALALSLAAGWRARRAKPSPSWVFAAVFVLLTLGVLAVYEGNAGTALRQRAMVIPFLVAIAATVPVPVTMPRRRTRTSAEAGPSTR
jgi:hypothetical protein